METMALKGTLVWLFSLAVLSFSAAQDETVEHDCTSKTLEQLSADLKGAVECAESLRSAVSTEQRAALLFSLRNLTHILHNHQLKECQGAEPMQCPEPEVPVNGGLMCATVDNKRYCKPMCSQGYDFGFIRRSRVFDECSEQTGYKWNTQYVGGNKLAVCNEASVRVGGSATSYFPVECQTLKTTSSILSSFIAGFTAELRATHAGGEPENACLVCG